MTHRQRQCVHWYGQDCAESGVRLGTPRLQGYVFGGEGIGQTDVPRPHSAHRGMRLRATADRSHRDLTQKILTC